MSEHFGHVRITVLTSRSTLTFMMSQPGLQTIAIYILPHISQSKGNQTIKFGQLIKHNEKYFSSEIVRKMRQGN